VNVVEGTTSSPLVFDVSVTLGTDPGLVILLPITGSTIWNVSGNTCPATLSPSLSCSFEATFSPNALGPRSFAVLYFFNYYDPTEQLPFGIDSGLIVLTGTGVAAATPLPAALPLFATGLGALGLLGWCRKRKALAA
jgi:hypothetical protein